MICLLDGDILLYECGFSSDANAKKDDLFDGHEPLEFTLKIVKNKIEELKNITEATSLEVYLTGKNNFRMEIQPDYKANRDVTHKPFWYNEIKDYLITTWDAVVVDGMEADDMLGIRQTEEEDWTCICSKDKDLDMIPGLHYNWSPKREKKIYHIDPIQGMQLFYQQILTGDATDNIPGMHRVMGKIATKKIKEHLMTLQTEEEMYNFIAECYGDYNFLPIAQCLWISQHGRERYNGPVSS